MATAAGLKTLEILARDGVFEHAEAMASRLASGLRQLLEANEVDGFVEQVGTMMTLFFGPSLPKDFDEVSACDHERFGRFHQGMLERGVYLPPSGYEAWFVSAAHTEADVDMALAAAAEALRL